MTNGTNGVGGANAGITIAAPLPMASNSPNLPSVAPAIADDTMEVSQDLTPQQVQQWESTMSHAAWVMPGFRHLFFKLLATNNKAGQAPHVAVMTNKVPVAATDAANILLNPENFFKMSIAERTFVLGHEVLHNVYHDVELLHRCQSIGKVPMHDGTTLPFNNRSMQAAMDYRINALLVESKIGKLPDKLEVDGQPYPPYYDLAIAGPNDSVLDIYKKVYEQDPEGDTPGGFDTLLPPGNSSGKSQTATPQQWQAGVAAANTLEQIRSQGKMAGALQRMFKEILEPEISWIEHITGTVNRIVGSGSRDWRRPDRRFIGRDIYLPSASGFGCGWLIVMGDTSGSISDKELCAYAAEMKGIIEDLRPKRLTVLWFDTKLQNIEELESAADLMNLHPKGGGGSDVCSTFKWVHDNADEPPEAVICFTDCALTIPASEPPFPVIWASVDKSAKLPYGEMVYINRKPKP